MWSPEGRKQNAAELRHIADKVLRYRQLCDRFASYFQPESDNARQLQTAPQQARRSPRPLPRSREAPRQGRGQDRRRRPREAGQERVPLGVAQEREAAPERGRALHLEHHRRRAGRRRAVLAPWSPTTARTSSRRGSRATSTRSSRAASSAGRGSTRPRSMRLKAAFKAREGFDVDDPDRAGKREQTALAELVDIAAGLGEIKSRLGKEPQRARGAQPRRAGRADPPVHRAQGHARTATGPTPACAR